MNAAQRYACRTCGTERLIPERPSTAPLSLRIGCENCARITRHGQVGRR